MVNRRRPYFPARKPIVLVARAWPLWLAVSLAAILFATLARPLASRHRQLRLAASLPAERAWLERALASAAISQNIPPGFPVAAETWRAHLDPRAPESLRLLGVDAFGHPYGPQSADRPIQLHPSTHLLLQTLNQTPHSQSPATPPPPLLPNLPHSNVKYSEE